MYGKARIQNQLHFKCHTQNNYQMQPLPITTDPKPILRLSWLRLKYLTAKTVCSFEEHDSLKYKK